MPWAWVQLLGQKDPLEKGMATTLVVQRMGRLLVGELGKVYKSWRKPNVDSWVLLQV